ncbi:MAG: GNAT family N-acetyltransferase [Spirochaetales bacterium]|nr:GNAT family N-acetyltransferase [Spirochaetales bacterium]
MIPVPPGYIVRDLLQSEAHLLKQFTYTAIFVPENAQPLPCSILQDPSIRLYYENFVQGSRTNGDYCILAQHDTEKAGTPLITGAAWSRILSGSPRGYGNINDTTPELSISVLPEHRGKGLGTALIGTLIQVLGREGFSSLSLSVQKANPACRLYTRAGFRVQEERPEEFIMIRTF